MFLFLIAVTINILNLLQLNSKILPDSDLTQPIFILSIVNIVISGSFFILWLIFRMPTERRIKEIEYRQTHSLKKAKKIPFLDNVFIITLYQSIMIQSHFQSFFFQFLFTLLGLFISPIFYTLTLLLIMHLSKLIMGIFESFIENLGKLVSTLILILLLINCFSYLLAENFRNNFSGDVGDQSQIICDTYFRCLINSINLGLRGGGGVSDYLNLNVQLTD